ncbi:16S rRNA (adenine(1518)-N(6)/adenine(1519)-N(6)) -dimethyltransferase [Mycoplasmopsis bovigenitalium]|uniref:16S rRNA (adenine(1518)-N(6)/adenine(1519)-N(6))- dimethyltransferase RsmA n=1 Tax=Mycoplasmopsis bovigenitalium TaxID=2112 RepID=UPI00090B2029|nr:16S rRNA (adenine(1518)-N(6)/adenine(1519)-N(6))-dimethyltransferase RsmA [Mycoplasmopsis bovigenitalium]BAW18527.1 16S rRNA (adenine(1518)-N(6)/adenine(1519)-N(6)) -dimethyltransferase [Mycoplasmopsis bovigenitalium]
MSKNTNIEIKAKKKFGQNFLNNQKIIDQIVEIISPEGKNIIEIGPGMGAITKQIVQKSKKLLAYEIDNDMVEYLTKNNILNNQQIIHQDFLESDLSIYNDYEIVGNIPYYITSEIIFKIIDFRKNFTKVTLMVQNEVADRIVAKINTPEYSKLSLTLQYVATVNKVLFVDKKHFDPSPKVDSAIVTIEFNKEAKNFENIKNFFKLCFLSRRKKLTWSLKTKYSNEKISKAYKTLNLSDLTRIQQLDLEQVIRLYEELEK